MKVGILTLFYKTYNYGAQFQSYALQKVIEKLGYECEQIRYEWSNAEITARYENVINRKKYLFEEFQMNIPHSKKIYTTNTINSSNLDYDIFVCGSDQIWGVENSLHISKLPQMLLSFVNDYKGKIAYAASYGGKTITDIERNNVVEHFAKKIDYLSMRESSAAEEMEKKIHRNIDTVLDPVLLLNRDEWCQCAEIHPKDNNKKYIFKYVFGKNLSIEKRTFKLSKEKNIEIIDIFNSYSAFGPKEFIKLINNASLVVTNSFHGTVLSIVFHKQFVVMPVDTLSNETSRNTRIIDLLKKLGLSDRYISDETIDFSQVFDSPIDYRIVDDKLSELIKNSMDFLKFALESSKEKVINYTTKHDCSNVYLSEETGKDYVDFIEKNFSKERVFCEIYRIKEYEKCQKMISELNREIIRSKILNKVRMYIDCKCHLEYDPCIKGDIYIYGAGIVGKELTLSSDKIKGFIDISNKLHNVAGLPVYKPDEHSLLFLSNKECTIIVTPVWDYMTVYEKIKEILPNANIVSIERIVDGL